MVRGHQSSVSFGTASRAPYDESDFNIAQRASGTKASLSVFTLHECIPVSVGLCNFLSIYLTSVVLSPFAILCRQQTITVFHQCLLSLSIVYQLLANYFRGVFDKSFTSTFVDIYHDFSYL